MTIPLRTPTQMNTLNPEKLMTITNFLLRYSFELIGTAFIAVSTLTLGYAMFHLARTDAQQKVTEEATVYKITLKNADGSSTFWIGHRVHESLYGDDVSFLDPSNKEIEIRAPNHAYTLEQL